MSVLQHISFADLNFFLFHTWMGPVVHIVHESHMFHHSVLEYARNWIVLTVLCRHGTFRSEKCMPFYTRYPCMGSDRGWANIRAINIVYY